MMSCIIEVIGLHRLKHNIHRHVHHMSHALTYHFETLSILLLTITCSVAFIWNELFAWTSPILQSNSSLLYPLKQVSSVACRQLMKPRWDLEEKCKVSLPIIQWADYQKYTDITEYRNIYTMLRWATYPWQRDMDKWDHAWVDIASASGTPLYSIAHGIVTFAGTQAGYGNVVKIMFRYKDMTYHAVYGHMNSISVNKWDIVEQGQLIGELGNSGDTFGALWWNHVHFEIDKDNGGKPAFYYQGCPALLDRSFTEITNGGLCRSYREMYSFDPIAFIESTRAWVEIAVNIHYAPDKNPPLISPNPTVSKQVLTPSFLALKTLKSYKLTRDASLFIKEQDIQFVAKYNKKMNIWQQWTISLYVTKKWTAKKFDGPLPTDISFVVSNTNVSVSQQSVQYISKWVYTISFTPKKIGKSVIAITLGGQTLSALNLEIIK